MHKLNEISKSLSKLPDYTQSSELKKVIENTSKIVLVLENAAHEIIQKEAITMFNAGLYFGCVSTLSCQLCGIITDTYEMHKQYGRQVNIQNLEDIYIFQSSG